MEFLIRLFRVKSNVIEGRIQILDYIRGMAILLVLLHHSGVPGGDWILAFHMPLLFFISDILISCERENGSFWITSGIDSCV